MTQTFTAGKNYFWIKTAIAVLFNGVAAFILFSKPHGNNAFLVFLFTPAVLLFLLVQKQIVSITVDDHELFIQYNQFFRTKQERYLYSEIKTILEKQAKLQANPPTDLRIVKKKSGQQLFRIPSGVLSAADFAAIHELVSGSSTRTS